MPSSIPQKTGYTFKGWRVKSCFASSVCGLTGSDVDGLQAINGGYKTKDGLNVYQDTQYGLTENGTWAVEFSNGGVARGIASCNSINSNTADTMWDEFDNGTITEDQVYNAVYGSCSSDAIKSGNTFDTSNTGIYCWCKMTSYTPHGDTQCNVVNAMWVFVSEADDGTASGCAGRCSAVCASSWFMDVTIFGHALLGVSQ